MGNFTRIGIKVICKVPRYIEEAFIHMGILRKWVASSRMHGSYAGGLRKVEEGVPDRGH